MNGIGSCMWIIRGGGEHMRIGKAWRYYSRFGITLVLAFGLDLWRENPETKALFPSRLYNSAHTLSTPHTLIRTSTIGRGDTISLFRSCLTAAATGGGTSARIHMWYVFTYSYARSLHLMVESQNTNKHIRLTQNRPSQMVRKLDESIYAHGQNS